MYTYTQFLQTEVLRSDWGLIDVFKYIQQITENKQWPVPGLMSKDIFPTAGKSITCNHWKSQRLMHWGVEKQQTESSYRTMSFLS